MLHLCVAVTTFKNTTTMGVSISFTIDWDHVCEAKADKRKSGGFGVKRLTDKWRDQTYSVKLFYHELDN